MALFRRKGGPRRIVHLLSSLAVGGMEQFVVRIAAAQRRRGADVSILALRPGLLAEEANKLGIPTRALDIKRTPERLARALVQLGTWSPDVIHCHNETSLRYGVLGSLVSRSDLVITCHGRGKLEGMRIAPEYEWKRVDAAIACSSGVAEVLGQDDTIRQRLRVILNGIELPDDDRDHRAEVRARVRSALKIPSERVVGIIVARIDGAKGHDTLVRALGFAHRQSPTDSPLMLLVGDGAKRMELEALAKELGLGDDQIRFLGFRKDVSELLHASDFFALPSLTEGLPLSMLEAMAHRLAVVATPVGGIPELLQADKQGLSMPAGDADALAAIMLRFSRDPAERTAFGEAGYVRVSTQFSFEAMLDAYDRLYDSLR